MKEKENELIEILNKEAHAKITARGEIERMQKEVARLQEKIDQAMLFIEQKDEKMNAIIKELRGE